MDAADHAQRLEEQARTRALNKNKAKFVGRDVDFMHCLECGIAIPKARRDAIHCCRHCVDCQELIEREQQHYRAKNG